MRAYRASAAWVVLTILTALTAAACAGREPNEASLKDSFAEQIASARVVSEFRRAGDELTFSGPKGGKADAKWRVHIDSAVVEPEGSQRNPYKGGIESSWFADGEALLSSGSFSGLPEAILDTGIGQECWAFWDASTKRWTWK